MHSNSNPYILSRNGLLFSHRCAHSTNDKHNPVKLDGMNVYLSLSSITLSVYKKEHLFQFLFKVRKTSTRTIRKNTRIQVTKNPLHFVYRDMNLFSVDGCSSPGLNTPGGICTAELCHRWIFCLALLSPDSPCQLDVLWLKGYMAAMQRDQIRIFEETN